MAQRRMISQDIVSSDAFLEMPASSQTLYFHLAVRADDDGFVQPKMVMRLVNAAEDDLRVLIAKRFVLSFDSGVVVIKHWLIHNLIRADLYKETMHRKEKASLGLNESGAYTELRDGVHQLKQIEEPKWLKQRRGVVRTENVPQTAHRIGKDRIGKDSLETPAARALFGEFKNIALSSEEYDKLCEALGKAPTDSLIAEMSSYLASTGKRYRSHYAALQNWARRRIQQAHTQTIKKGRGVIL